MILESGTGNGRLAGVDDDNRVLTASFNIPFSHLIAKDYQKTFTVFGETGTLQAASNSVLYLENDNENSIIVIDRFIGQAVGITPGAGNFWTLESDSAYDAGGTAVVPNNLSSGSSVTSGAVAYEGNFTLQGSPNLVDKIWPPMDLAIVDLDIDGGVLILPGKAVSIGFTSSAAAGFAKAALYFSVVSTDGYSG